MKCTSCHTHLPDFGKFQKAVCPNCGKPITKSIKKTADPQKPISYDSAMYIQQKATASRNKLLWSMIIGLVSLFVIIISAMFVHTEGPWLPTLLVLLGAIVNSCTTALSLFFFLRTLFIQRKLPKFLRPGFAPVLGLLFFSLIDTMLVLILAVGIHQNLEYKQNQHHFVEVEAYITRIDVSGTGEDTEYDIYISYNLDGKIYENVEYYRYESSMDVGDSLNVTVDPKNPEKLPRKGTMTILVFCILAPLALLATYFLFVRPLNHPWKNKKRIS